jgi:hypothetical protein
MVEIDPEAALRQMEDDMKLAMELDRMDREQEERERAERAERNQRNQQAIRRQASVRQPNPPQQQQRPGELSAAVRRRLEEAEAEAARRKAEIAAAGVETQTCNICFDDVPVV